MTKGVPINMNSEPLPITLLVTDPRAQSSFVGTSFGTIAELVCMLDEAPYKYKGAEASDGLKSSGRQPAWFDWYAHCKQHSNLNLFPYETQFFHYHLLRSHNSVSQMKAAEVREEKGRIYPRLVLPEPPIIQNVIDKPTHIFTSKRHFTTTVRETGPSKSNTDLVSQRKRAILDQCYCPDEF
jgi:hypothetical protein